MTLVALKNMADINNMGLPSLPPSWFSMFWVVTTLRVTGWMSAPLIECTREQRPVIRLLWSEGVKTGEIYGRTAVQYGDNCMSQRTETDRWQHTAYKGGRMSDVDARPERSQTVTWVQVKERIDKRIRDNWRISTDKRAPKLCINHGGMQYKNRLWPNRKHFILTESRNLTGN
jgi:hypothetical protein